jgi:hypothetical protein
MKPYWFYILGHSKEGECFPQAFFFVKIHYICKILAVPEDTFGKNGRLTEAKAGVLVLQICH